MMERLGHADFPEELSPQPFRGSHLWQHDLAGHFVGRVLAAEEKYGSHAASPQLSHQFVAAEIPERLLALVCLVEQARYHIFGIAGLRRRWETAHRYGGCF